MNTSEAMASPGEVLEALRAGEAINGEEGERILHDRYTDATNPAHNEVRRARGCGPARICSMYSFTGRPGNGKTQTLRQFTFTLPSENLAHEAIAAFSNRPWLLPRSALARAQHWKLTTSKCGGKAVLE